MSGHPTVSIIVNVYNGERFLRQTLDSVYTQTFTDWEIIFWDSASTDRTPDIAKEYDHRLRYFRTETKLPLGEARNLALQQARGKYVGFLDADDVYLPQKLEWLVPVLDERDEVAVAYADSATIDDEGQIISEHWGRYQPKDGNHLDELLGGHYIAWLTALFRKSVLDEVGGLRPYLISHDFDMIARIALDYPFVGIDRVVSQYRIHGGNISHNVVCIYKECIDVLETLIREAESKPHHQPYIPKLREQIANRHYFLGNHLCSTGEVSEGRIHLRQAWPDSAYRWKAVSLRLLTAICGAKGFQQLINCKRKIFNKK